MDDRTATVKVVAIVFTAEHTLPFNVVPDLLEYAK